MRQQQRRPAATEKVAVISIFTALAITTDYVMLPLANIKLMDTIVFVSSMVFGLDVGVSVGALTWVVYGTVNPLGSDSGLFLLLLVVSETVYAFLAYPARRASGPDLLARSVLWGSLGLIGAFLYDLNTIVTPSVLAGVPVGIALALTLPAIPFMLAHEISDFAFFATAGPLLVGVILRVARSRGQIAVPPAMRHLESSCEPHGPNASVDEQRAPAPAPYRSMPDSPSPRGE